MNLGGLRTSDADRDQVAILLNTAYAEGRLSYDEHSERSAAALQARTFDDLLQLTADLVPQAVAVPTSAHGPGVNDETDRVTAILSSGKRIGPWRATRSTSANVLLGDMLIDLTEATLESGTIEVNCAQLFGSIKIRVPLGTNVRIEMTDVLAESSVKGIGEPDPAMPTVIVKGINILGDIQVRGPKKPLPWKRNVI